jgi:proline dehydrogenase
VPHLQACIADAKREGYMLGVKLVRGAYQILELSVYNKRVAGGTWFGDSEPPVWTDKSDTDDAYNKVAYHFASSRSMAYPFSFPLVSEIIDV